MTNTQQAEITDEVEGVELDTAPEAEPATAVDESKGEFVETDSEKVQARINKITAEKYAEKRRAEQLEKELAAFRANTPNQAVDTKEPKLEDFDYDEQAYNDARIDYKVNLKAKEIAQQSQEVYDNNQAQAAQQQSQRKFDENLVKFKSKVSDYETVLQNLPLLPNHIMEVITTSENGPELAYHLSSHLDVADALIGMSQMQSGMQLGIISAQLSASTKTVKASDAPEPIDPINSGGSISDDKGTPGITYT